MRLRLALPLAFALTILSVRVQRTGPELAENGNLCGPARDEICWVPRVNGGFPLPYLFDVPAVSVPHQLGVGEDDFRVVPFVADLLFYLLLLMLLGRAWRRRRVAGGGRDAVIPGG